MKTKALQLFIFIAAISLVLAITSFAQTGYVCGDADGDQSGNLAWRARDMQ